MAHAQDLVHRVLEDRPGRGETADPSDGAVKQTVDDDVFDEVRRRQRRDLALDEVA